MENLQYQTDQDELIIHDGRQSPVSAAIARGVGRLFANYNQVSMPEVKLSSGRRADLMTVSKRGLITIVEIKSSVQDFRSDQKWPDYREFCDYFFFAIPETLSPNIIPETTGLIVADAFGGAILRDAPLHSLSAARRKAVTLRFARIASSRLQTVCDIQLKNDGFVKKVLDT